jgi:hypothetical protein
MLVACTDAHEMCVAVDGSCPISPRARHSPAVAVVDGDDGGASATTIVDVDAHGTYMCRRRGLHSDTVAPHHSPTFPPSCLSAPLSSYLPLFSTSA